MKCLICKKQNESVSPGMCYPCAMKTVDIGKYIKKALGELKNEKK